MNNALLRFTCYLLDASDVNLRSCIMNGRTKSDLLQITLERLLGSVSTSSKLVVGLEFSMVSIRRLRSPNPFERNSLDYGFQKGLRPLRSAIALCFMDVYCRLDKIKGFWIAKHSLLCHSCLVETEQMHCLGSRSILVSASTR